MFSVPANELGWTTFREYWSRWSAPQKHWSLNDDWFVLWFRQRRIFRLKVLSRRQSNSEINRLDLLSEFEQGQGSLAPPRIFPYSSRRSSAPQGMIKRSFSTIPPTQSARPPRDTGTRRRSNRRRRCQSPGSQFLCHHRTALRQPLKHREQSHQQSHRSAQRRASNHSRKVRFLTKIHVNK